MSNPALQTRLSSFERAQALTLAAAILAAAATTPDQAGFQSTVQPFPAKTCYGCHSAKLQSAGLNLQRYIADSNRHTHEKLPILLMGGANGDIETGRHVANEKDTPVANLFQAMMNRTGVRRDSFGDSTGALEI